MSWYRRIKCLFTIEVVMFSYIVWSTLNFIITKKHISNILFFSILTSVFFMEYINYKKNNKWLVLGVPILLGLSVNFFLNKSFISFTLNSAYILFIIVYSYNIEKNNVNYYFSRDVFKKSLFIVILLWIITMLFGNISNKTFFRFYIIYFTIGIIYLREIRDYNYNIINKKSLIIDGITVGFIFSLSIEKFYDIFFKGLMLLKTIFDYVVNVVIKMLIFVLDKPYTAILNFLKSLFKEEVVSEKGTLKKKVIEKKTKEMISYADKDINFLRIIIRIVVFLIISIIVYKIVSKLMYHSSKEENTNVISEEKEKIEIGGKKKKKNILNKFIKSIYFGKDPKNKIKYFYRQLQMYSKEKEIFDEYMTATQLENSIIINRDVEKEDLKYITDRYNEVKFSQHEIEKRTAEEFKNRYIKVKKKI
ncbi:hypothetical protein [Haloimpatiens massiliensis]|uniref:hypothetical protein n=1 Tax=Haloimpatiens massiliensis TaxID=1658110 RepID=UPI000C815C00|nr:hypothetical protein [Haloimpatiens massiliensis]